MPIFKKCPFYRESESLTVGKGLGYCDLCGEQAICEGDIQACDKPDTLSKQLLEQYKQDRWKEKENQSAAKPKYKILVVDDEEPIRALVKTLLARQGHQTITAGDGNEALSKIHQNRVDAVITDIVMPHMDGITLTKEILSLHPKIPIMIMTGYRKEYPTESALTAGAREFIGKPFSIDEFILRFNKMMDDDQKLSSMEAKQNELFLQLHTIRQ